MLITSADLCNGLTMLYKLENLPAESIIEDVRIKVIKAFEGGEFITISSHEKQGVATGIDGLLTDEEGAVVNLTLDATVVGYGELINGKATTSDSIISISCRGEFTAGEMKLTISYTDPDGDAQTLAAVI